MSGWSRPSEWIAVLAVSALAGVGYNALFDAADRLLVSAVYGVFIGGTVYSIVRGEALPGLQRWLRRLSFPAYLPAALVIDVTAIIASRTVAGTLLWSIGATGGTLGQAIALTPQMVLYSLAVSIAIVFVLRMMDLIGRETFISLLTGRYHRPVREERVFLFIDVVGSTRFAATHGDLSAQEFLAGFFAALAEPVRRCRGVIDDYVGDLAIVSWPLARGIESARCVDCVFTLAKALARDADGWTSRFGLVPRFRAALHCGQVVAAEIGVDRHKIAYFGDTVNATSRIEELCRTLDVPVLISADLLGRLAALPPGVAATEMGEHALRGRGEPLALAALVPRPTAVSVPVAAE